jgi:hypothetical protein
MKKVKCYSCFRTKPESAFIEKRNEKKVVFETCAECRELEERVRRKQLKQVALQQARDLGLLKNKRSDNGKSTAQKTPF